MMSHFRISLSFFRQFLCIRNIRIFLQACSNVFGLAKEDLFEPMWLYEATNFKMVCANLFFSNTLYTTALGGLWSTALVVSP